MTSPQAPTQSRAVSVIVPTYSRKALLLRAIASITAQSYRPIEIVIVDDCSPCPVQASWFPTLPSGISLDIIRQDSSTGPARARNRGIEECTGVWVAFLDDDDCWEPEKLTLQIEALARSPKTNVKAAGCHIILVNGNDRETRRTAFPLEKQQIIAGMVYKDENLNPSTLLVDRNVFSVVGSFDEELPTAEDRQWLLRYLIKFDIVIVDEYLTRYTEHTGPRLTTNFEAMLHGELRFATFIEQSTKALNVQHSKAMGYRYAKLGNEYMLAGRWRDGISFFVRAIANCTFEYRAWAGLAIAMLGPKFYRRALSFRMNRIRLTTGMDSGKVC